MFRKPFILLLFLVLALGACQTAEEPTPIPTAEPTPTATIAPTAAPTIEPTAEPTSTAVPTAEPTAAPTEEPTAVPTPEPPSVEFEGIRFEQGGLATAVIPTIVPEQIMADGGPYWGTHPAYYQFDFEDYPLEETFHTPRLTIYPAPAYAGLNLAAREEIEALTALLADPATGLAQDNLPFIPLFNASQVLHSQAELVAFGNGHGVRYLTAYAQSIFPLSNQELFYTFQGLTDDGAYYVSAIFPISSAILPNTPPSLTAEEWEALSENYMEYLAETTAELDALTADEFLPTLSSLDQLVESLEVTPPSIARPANQLALDFPVNQGQYLAGETVHAAGLANPSAGNITLTLFAGPHQVAELEAAVASTGAWSTNFTLPTHIIGPGRVIVQAGTERISHAISIYPEQLGEQAPPPRVVVYRPFPGELLVEGVTNFIAGEVTNPINNTVTIGVLTEDCTTFIARQSFTVTGGQWFGQLILPPDTAGPACVTAYTGQHGDSAGYEWLVKTTVVTADHLTAPRLQIGTPYGTVNKGQSFTLFGMAVNAPNNQVSIAITRDDGTEILTTTAAVDTFGYWEADILLPADAPPFILATASFTDGQRYEYQTGFAVQ